MPQQPTKTSLHKNPFSVLRATTRDSRARILQLAEEKSLAGDEEEIREAQSALLNPRTRLVAELRWLPGVSPNKAQQLLSDLSNSVDLQAKAGTLPPIAQLNVLSAYFETMKPDTAPDTIAALIQHAARVFQTVSSSDLLRDLNEDRAVAGFAEIKSADQIETEIAERRRYYRGAIKDALDQQPSSVLVELMTKIVTEATDGGEEHAPELIDDLVDSYALEAQDFLERERDNVFKLLDAARTAASAGEGLLEGLLAKIEAVTRNWDSIAQPVQLSFKARGIRHEPSRELAYAIRDLAIDLYNKHDFAASPKRLMDLLQELFAELPDVLEKVEEDAEALVELLDDKRAAEAGQAEWARELKYEADLGLVSKTRLSVSVDGVAWGSQRFPLQSITRVRWGGVRHSVNGIPTGTSFTIAFGDGRSEAVVELRNKEIYSTFISKLWQAVGSQIIIRILTALKSGQEMRIGDAVLRDDGVTLARQKFFGSAELIRYAWSDVQVWSAGGSFFIGATHDKKARVELSYITAANTHAVELILRAAFKKSGLKRLSDLM